MNWYELEPALGRLTQARLPAAARARLVRLGHRAATEGAALAHQADHAGPVLRTHDRSGNRVDEIVYHPAYRQLQALGYGEGLVAATWNPALAPERGSAPRTLTFALGYLFAQAEAGMFCPVTMTDGAALLLHRFATPELTGRFLPRLASTDLATLHTGAMFLTEKQGGSDVGTCTTEARGGRGVPGEVVSLHGEKWFCSNVDADLIMILARPTGAPAGTRGLGLYVLPREWEGQRNGYRIDRLKDKLGERSFPTGEVTLDGARAWLLGGPGQGFHQMTEMLNLSRLYNAVASVAVMRRAVVEAWDFCQGRVAFGRPVTEHPLMTETLLDLACEQRLALNWTFRAVQLMDAVDFGAPSEHERRALRMLTPLLKYVLGKKAVAVVSEAVEALGGNGYIEDWPLARVLRDAQVLPIWEGTSNILVLDAFRVMRKERGHEALFAEVERGAAEAPARLQARLQELLAELKGALGQLAGAPGTEFAWRDWTDRAALLWSAAVSCSTSLGHGTPTDVRAAERILARQVPRGLLRTDRASVEEVRAVAFG